MHKYELNEALPFGGKEQVNIEAGFYLSDLID